MSDFSELGDCPVVSLPLSDLFNLSDAACPVVSLPLPDLASGVAWPVVCGALCSPFFVDGASFSAGAFCCAAGARSGMLFMPCADAAPALNNNANATVDNNLAFLTESSSGCPRIPDHVETSCKNVLPDRSVPKLT